MSRAVPPVGIYSIKISCELIIKKFFIIFYFTILGNGSSIATSNEEAIEKRCVSHGVQIKWLLRHTSNISNFLVAKSRVLVS